MTYRLSIATVDADTYLCPEECAGRHLRWEPFASVAHAASFLGVNADVFGGSLRLGSSKISTPRGYFFVRLREIEDRKPEPHECWREDHRYGGMLLRELCVHRLGVYRGGKGGW